MKQTITGLESLINNPPSWIKDKRLGLLLNPASVNTSFSFSRDIINTRFPGQLKALFSPQHGYFAAKQDNMIESYDIKDNELDIPVYSLYGKTRKPHPKMFDNIDILLIDIQDVGTRVYTFIYTVSYCMEAAKQYNKKIAILDRPNPIGGEQVEGNCLDTDFASFVGRYPIPMRHGMTIGEISLLFNNYFKINCDLEVVPMKGWNRQMYFKDTQLPWVAPSPNLPTPESAIVYPGQVIWEGTNVSEGRGTTQPFEIFGAPYIDPKKILNTVGEIPGICLRTACFEPTFNKWKSEICNGFQIHVTDNKLYKPYIASLKLLQAIIKCHPKDFKWKSPPYEYEFEKQPIDLILGSKDLRKSIENMESLDKNESMWQKELNNFKTISEKYWLYE